MNKKIKNVILLELGIIFLVLIIFIIIKTELINVVPQCIIKKNFNILCPGCGGTRCVINFMQGNFKQSFIYHPVLFMTLIYLIIINIIYIINAFRKNQILKILYPKEKFGIAFIVILFIFTVLRNII